MDILARAGICERASIDECYLDLTAESKKRLAAAAGQPPAPPSFDEVHVCAEHGPVSAAPICTCSLQHPSQAAFAELLTSVPACCVSAPCNPAALPGICCRSQRLT